MANLHWSYYLLFISLIIAVYTDVTRHKIYNWLTFPMLAFGLIFSFVKSGGTGLLDGFLGFLLAFVISFVLYITKGIYGGDVKLIAAIGAWIGKNFVLPTFLWIFMCGGVLGVLYTVKNGTFIPTAKKVGRFFTALIIPGMKPEAEIKESINEYVPYGVAIAAGTLINLLYPNLLSFSK